jgi:ubiquinone biosynthesis monooxygenase Coq7
VDAARETVANILRVDHAGEYGAIRIYRAQRWLAAWRAANLLPFLDRTLDDECRHRVAFEHLMRERKLRPCRTLAFWGLGGSLLGLVTGALGSPAILVCTAAVERTVHKHLEAQALWLERHDPEIAKVLLAIMVEEMEHLQFAETHRAVSSQFGWPRVLDATIAAATEALIWLSTYGAASRMARQITELKG